MTKGPSQNISSLDCELRIIRARNLDSISTGNLFVRYYICTGGDNSRRIQLNSRELSWRCNPYWNESVSLECNSSGAENDAMDKLKQQTIVFELRWRKTKFSGSKLLLRSEVGWKDVLDSAELSIEKWVASATTTKYVGEDLKPPALQIGMKVRVPIGSEIVKRNHVVSTTQCGCRDGSCNGRDDDIFALAAALEVL